MSALLAIHDSTPAMTAAHATTVAAVADAAAGGTAAPLGLPALLLIFAVGSGFVIAWSRWVRPMNLALGFACTVAMWAISFVAMLQPGFAIAELLFVAALGTVVVAGFAAGRFAPAEARGLSVGLVSATINLMVIGAFLRDEQDPTHLRAVAYVLGLFLASGVLGLIGERIGRARMSMRRLPSAITVMGIVTTACILAMIVLGGLVTSFEAGLAVPDWPNSFGHNMLLYPVSEMKGGIFYEHTHRLFGMLVGATVLAYSSMAWRTGAPRYARVLIAALLLMVIVQGVLGGKRVTGNFTSSMDAKDLAPSTTLALVHGMLGQLVFATAMVSAFVVSGAWQRADAAIHRARSVRMLTMLAFLALCGQLFLGASMRHLQVPPTADAGARIPAWALHGHVTMALVAFFLVLLAGLRCSRVQEIPPLRRLGKSLMHTVGLQLVLGIAALVAVVIRRGEVVPWWEVASTTAHQTVGALLLAITASAMVLARRTREA